MAPAAAARHPYDTHRLPALCVLDPVSELLVSTLPQPIIEQHHVAVLLVDRPQLRARLAQVLLEPLAHRRRMLDRACRRALLKLRIGPLRAAADRYATSWRDRAHNNAAPVVLFRHERSAAPLQRVWPAIFSSTCLVDTLSTTATSLLATMLVSVSLSTV